jgi:hypothetical protein
MTTSKEQRYRTLYTLFMNTFDVAYVKTKKGANKT